MKFFKEFALVAATTLLSGLPISASASSMVEITYQNSQYQCDAESAQSTILVDVYHNGELIKDGLAVGESVMVPDFDGVELDYQAATGSCGFGANKSLLLGSNDSVPNLAGAYEQEAIASLIANLKDYEDLYLVELGTTNTSSFAYDLQDAVFVVNNNPSVINPETTSNPIAFAD